MSSGPASSSNGSGAPLDLEPLGPAQGQGSTGPRMLVPLFLVPLLIVVLIVAVFLGVGALVGHEESTTELVGRIETGGVNERWQAAAKLTDVALKDPPKLADPALRARIRRAFEVYGPQDPRLRLYFASLWAAVGDADAVPLLVDGVQRARASLAEPGGRAGPKSEEASKELIFYVRALGELKVASAEPLVLELADDPDQGIRLAVAESLGNLGRAGIARGDALSPTLVAALRKLQEDGDAWVRMNAALSLAKAGRAEGLPTLELMLDRDYYRSQHLRFPDDGRYTVDNYDPASDYIRFALAAIAELARRAEPAGTSLRGDSLKAALAKASKDRNPAIQKSAADLLAKLGG